MTTQAPKPVTFAGSGAESNTAQAPVPLYLVGGIPAGQVPAATASVIGGVKKAATVANATDAASVITQLNLLLTNLRAAGTIV